MDYVSMYDRTLSSLTNNGSIVKTVKNVSGWSGELRTSLLSLTDAPLLLVGTALASAGGTGRVVSSLNQENAFSTVLQSLQGQSVFATSPVEALRSGPVDVTLSQWAQMKIANNGCVARVVVDAWLTEGPSTPKFTLDLVRSTNARLTQGFQGSGEMRTCLSVPGMTDALGVLPSMVPAQLQALLAFVNESFAKEDQGPMERFALAAVFYYAFMQLHPFTTGTEATARTMVMYLLANDAPVPFVLDTTSPTDIGGLLQEVDRQPTTSPDVSSLGELFARSASAWSLRVGRICGVSLDPSGEVVNSSKGHTKADEQSTVGQSSSPQNLSARQTANRSAGVDVDEVQVDDGFTTVSVTATTVAFCVNTEVTRCAGLAGTVVHGPGVLPPRSRLKVARLSAPPHCAGSCSRAGTASAVPGTGAVCQSANCTTVTPSAGWAAISQPLSTSNLMRHDAAGATAVLPDVAQCGLHTPSTCA
eukprot:CAMPEP_0170732084 /NCGR_PEP_ID=MMETSP0437-20130122/1374_1 /TAXON_ID=0 /ORGANISM="Sexangularia sp." /LENGTH=474 /DNA_ID=CAMNT_0011070319 /DNA_START=10 /DNA_END=1436 /DNA_ORIENTATION=+